MSSADATPFLEGSRPAAKNRKSKQKFQGFSPRKSHARAPEEEAKRLRQLRAFETADYSTNESEAYYTHQAGLTESDLAWINTGRWVLVVVIGLLTGLMAFAVDYCTDLLQEWKAERSTELLNGWPEGVAVGRIFGVFMGVNMLYVFGACMLVFYEPNAAGSGVPEVMAYLNGAKIPHVVRFKVLFCKVVGVILAVAGSICCGKEGPMIHIGSIIGGSISQGKSRNFSLPGRVFKEFRNDREKRDFVSAGAAAGVAAAFGAPVGGLLFALEEGASFWDRALTFRAFLCSCVSAFTRDFLLSGALYGLWGKLAITKVLNFGAFAEAEHTGYSMAEFPFFLCLGVIGGLLGALFVSLNSRILKLRMRYLPAAGKRARVAEVLAISLVTSLLFFYLPLAFGSCQPFDDAGPGSDHEMIVHLQKRVGCPEGNVSDLGSIMYNRMESAIKLLFHSKTSFSAMSLIAGTITYFFLALITVGIAVPAGLFVPCLLIGAQYGRLVGMLLHNWLGSAIAEGTFALIGAASMLGGAMRINLSATVFLTETTNDSSWLLPIMLTLIVSKVVGDFFNHGVFDMHIHLKNMPFLEYHPDHSSTIFRAKDVMNKHVVRLNIVEKVGTIVDVLRSTTHNGFPVVEVFPGGRGSASFVGLVLRDTLCVLLSHPEQFINRGESYNKASISLDELCDDYPWYPTIEAAVAKLQPGDLDRYVSLMPYINPSPSIIQSNASLLQTHTIFRSLGVRHVVVLGPDHEIVGMITRYDLLKFDAEKTDPHRASNILLKTNPIPVAVQAV